MQKPRGPITAIRGILKRIDQTCDQDQRIDSWSALQTTRAVALAALARALSSVKNLRADQEARELLYQAIASEPYLVDAYLQLAQLYMCRREEFAKDWRLRAESLLRRADDLNPACGTKDMLRELYEVGTEAAGDQPCIPDSAIASAASPKNVPNGS
jgi:hypothetical protein